MLLLSKNNFGSEEFPHSKVAFIQATLPSLDIKLEILQNIPFLREPTIIEGIPIVHDDDLGSMKLLAAADRGTRKDFYDLYLLTQNKPLEYYYNCLKERAERFNHHVNLFDKSGNKPSILIKDITPLADFNKAASEKERNNQIIFTKDSDINLNWFELKTAWKKKVEDLVKSQNILFKISPSQRTYKKKGFQR